VNPADLFANEENLVRLAAGETLFKTGDFGDCVFVLLEGSMNIRVRDKIVEQAERGAILGEMATFAHSPRTATVIAREPSTLVQLDERRFRYLISSNSAFAMHVLKMMADRIRQTNQLLSQK
jgi:CRP-like cAMP-binding protein